MKKSAEMIKGHEMDYYEDLKAEYNE